MQPTIGRTVHYQPAGSRPPEHQPRAAIITGLLPSGDVALTVFKPTGVDFGVAAVFSERPRAGCWSWPPRV